MSTESHFIIAVDGPSGAGKTTLLRHLALHLSALGRRALHWTNADDEMFGPGIRELADSGRNHISLTLALAAARARLLETSIEADVVLCDRFIASSLVYQVYAGVPVDYVVAVNRPFLGRVTTVILEIDAVTLDARRQQRASEKKDWFKRSMPLAEELALYQAARHLLERQGHRPIVIDASGSLGRTQEALVNALSPVWQAAQPS